MAKQLENSDILLIANHLSKRKFFESEYNRVKDNPNHAVIQECINGISLEILRYDNILENEELNYRSRLMYSASKKSAERTREKLREKIKTIIGLGVSNHHENNSDNEKIRWKDLDSAFDGKMKIATILNLKHYNLSEFFTEAKQMLIEKIKNLLSKENSFKINLILSGNFEIIKNNQSKVETNYFSSGIVIVMRSTDLDEILTTKLEEITKIIEDSSEMKDSGWSLKEILDLEVHINVYDPLRGGEFFTVPKWVAKKKAVINVQNNDSYCFLYAVLAGLYKFPINPQRKSSYVTINCNDPFRGILNYENFNFPMSLRDIPKFEKLNDLSISVYGLEYERDEDYKIKRTESGTKKQLIVPYHLSIYTPQNPEKTLNFDMVIEKKTIHLLMLKKNHDDEENDDDDDDDDDDVVYDNNNDDYHYTWIRDLSRLVSSQTSKNKGRKWFCDRCLCNFVTQRSLLNHQEACLSKNQYRMQMPRFPNHILKFKNFKYLLKVPFVVYADIECLLKKVDNADAMGKSEITQKHEPYSVGYHLQCEYDENLSYNRLNRGENCIEWFINELYNIAIQVNDKLINYEPIQMTEINEQNFNESTECYICRKSFTAEDPKVRDHNHFTGAYRGSAHSSCNINYQESCVIPVVTHNLSGYDAHFIIKKLTSQFNGKMRLLPINKEKYIAFTKFVEGTKIQLRFIDSFRFMASSIEKLASYLDDEDKKITKKFYPNKNEFDLVIKKGVFPYDFVDGFDKLEFPNLPSKEEFYSSLKDATISDEEYNHACNVWRTFGFKTLGEYSDKYLMTDILLLADIFENFRDDCLKIYKLDPLHFFTSPSLAMQAMLKITEVEIELLTDPEKLLFIENGIRGGMTQCSKRLVQANNKYMNEEDRRPDLPSNFLIYLDVNNLYGSAMRAHLPLRKFEWDNNVDLEVILNTADNSEIGYILECDFIYPDELHDKHKDLPLAPEQLIPPLETSKFSKLLTTLYNKEKYVIHYINLKQYGSLGLRVSNVHRVLKFEQSDWLKKWIDHNTELRKVAKNEFEVSLRKLLINSTFGSLMQNMRKQRDVRIVSQYGGRYGAASLIAKPNFKSSTIIENVVIIEMSRLKVLFNKPIFVGFSILDISKTYIYDWHYNYMQATFGDKASLAYLDTDGVIYDVETDDIYEYIKRDSHKFDTSNYPENNIFQIERKHKREIGLMKDENGGQIMEKFVGLRAKMYAYQVKRKDEQLKVDHLKAKGVAKPALRTITFQDYENCLLDGINLVRPQLRIQSRKHDVTTIKTKKLALSSNDDKRMILPDGINTLPWGHYSKRRRLNDGNFVGINDDDNDIQILNDDDDVEILDDDDIQIL